MNIRFEGKRALVTGAGRGIGREIATALAKGGAETFALSFTKANLDSLKAEVPEIQTVCVDIGDWQAARQAVEQLGPLDLLVNNAGIATSMGDLEVSPEEFDKVLNINTKAALNMMQVVAKGMIERKSGGSIVNISSQASQAALKNHVVYGASKAAMDQMTRVMALDLGPHKCGRFYWPSG